MCKCKMRGIRRDLTERYSKRQVTLYANFYGWEEALRRRKGYNYHTHNSLNCGNARCCFCMNDRRNPWHSKKEKLTLAEQRMYDSFIDQLNDYLDQ